MLDIITIGTATRDVFLSSSFFRVLKDPDHLEKIGFPTGEAQCFALGGKIEVDEPIFTTGGGATNAAVTFTRQGFKTGSLFKIGKDPIGKEIENELKQENIEVISVEDDKFPTGYDTILLSPSGERTILINRGASEKLTKEEIPLSKLDAKWAYVAPGNISFEVLTEIIDFLYEKGVLIAINPSKALIEKKISGLENVLKKSKVIILNREEASYLTEIDYKNELEIFKIIDEMTPGIAVMTDGSGGAMVSDGHRIYWAGIFKETAVVDRTGAGDAFGSGFVAGLMHKGEKCDKDFCEEENIRYAIRLGSANATSGIESVGAKSGILTRKEFEESDRWKDLKIEIREIK